jgi:hypothetical protein
LRWLASSDPRLPLHSEALCIYLRADRLGRDLVAASRTIPPRCWGRRRRRLLKIAFRRRSRRLLSPPLSTAHWRGAHTAALCSRVSPSFSSALYASRSRTRPFTNTRGRSAQAPVGSCRTGKARARGAWQYPRRARPNSVCVPPQPDSQSLTHMESGRAITSFDHGHAHMETRRRDPQVDPVGAIPVRTDASRSLTKSPQFAGIFAIRTRDVRVSDDS